MGGDETVRAQSAVCSSIDPIVSLDRQLSFGHRWSVYLAHCTLPIVQWVLSLVVSSSFYFVF